MLTSTWSKSSKTGFLMQCRQLNLRQNKYSNLEVTTGTMFCKQIDVFTHCTHTYESGQIDVVDVPHLKRRNIIAYSTHI